MFYDSRLFSDDKKQGKWITTARFSVACTSDTFASNSSTWFLFLDFEERIAPLELPAAEV